MRRLLFTGLVALTSGALATAAEAREPSLRGSPASMQEQNRVALAHGLAFYRTSAEIRAAVDRGELMPLEGNENYDVAAFVSHPYAHPAAVLFVERLSAQYREACGQKLVVTSAVRAANAQPRNAHRLSVHPAGMALDLRVSDRQSCRAWLEGALMNLEREGVLNGIRERNPPHYHVALYPEQYLAYVAPMIAAEEAEAAARAEAEALAAAEREAAEAAAAAAPPIVQGNAGAPSLPAAPLVAALALLAAVPMSRLALRSAWLRRAGEDTSPEEAAVMAPETETR